MKTFSISRKRRKKGSAAIVAAVLFTAIFVAVIGVYFYTNQFLLYRYNQEVREETIMSGQKAQEQFDVEGFLDSKNFLWARVNNTGPIPIIIIHVFVTNTTSSDVIKDLPVSSALNPGLCESINTTYSYQGEPVIIKVLTERGNTGANVYPPIIIMGIGKIEVGPFIFSLDPTAFRYTLITPSIDQKQESSSSTYKIYGLNWAAQSFVAGTTGSLTKIEVYTSKYYYPANLIVEIRSDSSNNPGSILASQTVSSSSITSANWYTVSFSSSPGLNSGTKYWIVLHQESNGGSSSNYYNWYYSSDSNSYLNGEMKTSTNGGSSWSSSGGDFTFRTYMSTGGSLSPGFEIPSNADKLVFYVNITNNSDKDIAFGKLSYFLVIVPEVSGHRYEDEIYFWLLQNTSNPQNPIAYNPDYNQIVPSKGSTILVFGSTTSGGNQLNVNDVLIGPELNNGPNDLSDENLAWTFLLISWKFVDSEAVIVENIPYIAIHILPS